MKYLLDTNAVIALVNRRSVSLLERIRDLEPALPFEAVEFTKDDAREAGELRALHARAGAPVGPFDLLIAAQAKVRDLVLITGNTAEFARIPDLRVENWL